MKRPGVTGAKLRARQRHLAHHPPIKRVKKGPAAKSAPDQPVNLSSLVNLGRSLRETGGYKDEHHLLVEKVPPESLIAMRTELAHPANADIYALAIKGKTFEECIAAIAVGVDIALDGEYDGPDLFALLHKALYQRRITGANNSPHNIDPRLRQVELVEREGTVTLEEGTGTIAPVPQGSVGAGTSFSTFMVENNCTVCENRLACMRARKCLGENAAEVGGVVEE